jgi:hypothetical protein
VPHRRKSLILTLAHKLGVEAHRLSILNSTLRQLRQALDRLAVEVLVCVAIIFGIWHLLSDTLSRLLSSLFK